MDSIFSYDSKLVQMLIRLADLMLLNILFLVCCIPLVTIGAAQTGLHSAITQMQNKENDDSVYKAFFKGFTNGFGKITLVHTLGLLVVIALIWATGVAFGVTLQTGSSTFPAWMCVVACVLALLFHSMLTPFHSHFDCTAKQLVKNVYLMTLAHPLRALVNALLTWIPFLMLILDPINIFMRAVPVWILLYYSIAFLFCHSVMKKPFDGLKSDFEEMQKLSAQLEDAGAEEASENPPEEEDDDF